jgi:hypothetical protein
MEEAAGEAHEAGIRLSFDLRVKLEFHTVTGDDYSRPHSRTVSCGYVCHPLFTVESLV